MKKVLFLFVIFLTFTLTAFSQVIDYTGKTNPYTKLSQEEKDKKLYDLCDTYINKDDIDDLKKRTNKAKLLINAGANPNQLIYNKSLLYDSIHSRYFPLVKVFIDGGADLNFIYDDMHSILTEMINQKFSKDEIEYAIKKGARPYLLKDEKGWAPIIEAIQKRNLEIVKLLESYGADLKTKNPWGWSTLVEAARANDLEIVKYCISKGIKPAHDKNAAPEIFFALSNSNIEMVKYLLENGADINEPFISNFGYYVDNLTYPLHTLLESKILEISDGSYYKCYTPGYLKQVMELGADPFLKDGHGRNAIDISAGIMAKCGFMIYENEYNTQSTIKVNELSAFIKDTEKFIPSSYKKTAAHAFITGDTEAFKKYSKTYKSDKHISVLYKLAVYFNFPNMEENLTILMNTGMKPSYYNISYQIRYGKYNFAKILAKNVNLMNGDEKWKHDFVSFCKNDIYRLFESDLIKSYCEGFLALGFTPDTLVYDEQSKKQITLRKFIELYDETDSKMGIKIINGIK